jgi:catalase-peroxidase
VIWDQKSNYVTGDYKDVEYIWQDPTPTGKLLTSKEEDDIRKTLSDSDLSIQEMVNTALSSAITFRGSDNRGGANGSRIRLEPQKKLGCQ